MRRFQNWRKSASFAPARTHSTSARANAGLIARENHALSGVGQSDGHMHKFTRRLVAALLHHAVALHARGDLTPDVVGARALDGNHGSPLSVHTAVKDSCAGMGGARNFRRPRPVPSRILMYL